MLAVNIGVTGVGLGRFSFFGLFFTEAKPKVDVALALGLLLNR